MFSQRLPPWSIEDLNKYINLKNRVEARMAIVDLSATFEEPSLMRTPSKSDDPERARVSAQQGLIFPQNPHAACDEIGLNWWAALKLHEDGWLSFNPETTPQLDESTDAELRFRRFLSFPNSVWERGQTVILNGVSPWAKVGGETQ